MTVDGIGTRTSPIFIPDSEEETIQELSRQQFYESSSLTGKHDVAESTHQHQCSTLHTSGVAGKRKFQEEDESVVPCVGNGSLTPSTSLENRLSQPKKARKRRRKLEREALERKKLQSTDGLEKPSSCPPSPAPGPGPPGPSLQDRLKAERQYSEYLDDILRLENQADMAFYENGPPSSSPSTSTFESDWVSSMVIAGEFPHCKKVKTTTTTKLSPLLTPKPLPASAPSAPSVPSSGILPPIHIYRDLAVSTEAPTPIQPPPQAPSGNLPQNIGMKLEQDPNGIHGIFRITSDTREGGAGMKKRKNPYAPSPSRTLVLEQLPKTHRTIHFVDNWCRSACGIPPLHLFVDPPSATALIEFSTADLAKKAWGSPRLGQHLRGTKSHLLKGRAREDLIKAWWYRADGGKIRSGTGELEEGEIEENKMVEGKMQVVPAPPLPARKESKKERKARLAKEREAKKMATMKENQQHQKQEQNPSLSNSQPLTPAQVPATSRQPSLPSAPAAFSPPFDPILGSFLPLAQPWAYPFTQPVPQTQSLYSTPPYSTTSKVGPSLAPGAQKGHGDSASIISSGGESSPYLLSGKATIVVAPSKNVGVATTVGQADDYSEVDMEVDDEIFATSGPTPAWKKSASFTANPPQVSVSPDQFIKNNLSSQSLMPPRPNTVGRQLEEETRSQQPFFPNNRPPHQPQRRFSSSTSVTPSSSSSQHTFSSLLSKSVPTPTAANNTLPSSESKATTNVLHSEFKHAASVRSKLEEQISKSKVELLPGNPTTQAASHPVSASAAPLSVAPSSVSAGQAMEENLRQRVFASKRLRISGVQPHPSSQLRSSISADVNISAPVHNFAAKALPSDDATEPQIEGNNKIVNDETPDSASSSTATPPLLSSTASNQSTFSFEDLATTFITQTIENIKANNNPPGPDPPPVNPWSGITVTSASATASITPSLTSPPPTIVVTVPPASAPSNSNVSGCAAIPDKLLPMVTNTSVNLIKSELTAKQIRLEKHLQESKSLMQRISTAKTKREKELLLKIMSEKIRLFEEENKASEKKVANMDNPASVSNKNLARNKAQRTTVFQFRQWPTTENNSILVLSDDED